jgi:hypothetical protein
VHLRKELENVLVGGGPEPKERVLVGSEAGFGSPRRGSVKVDALGDADDEVPLGPTLRGGGKMWR